ncbi:hypothetical protein [Pseudonocardia oroxyli]|uniref:hypothetical protein n=1 Tax=Pseudonocardia oroxyli TaxID=366584 RepID=UPI0015A02E91|nr:hypothetical protein [Pseudonocardia oroxyli]
MADPARGDLRRRRGARPGPGRGRRDHVWQRLYRDLRTGLHHAPPEDVVLRERAAHLLEAT